MFHIHFFAYQDSGDVVSWSRNNDAIPNEERPKSRDDESYLRKSGMLAYLFCSLPSAQASCMVSFRKSNLKIYPL